MHSSHLAPSASPSSPNTLLKLLQRQAEEDPDNLAYRFIEDDDSKITTISYGELDRRARAIGAWLESFDASGERALLLYPPGLDFIASFMGCLYAGVTAVPAYPPRLNRPVPRIQSIVKDSQASFALTTSTILSNIEQRFEHTPDLQALHWLNTEQVSAGLEADWRHPNITSDTLAFLQYTSGSTSQPKGVMLSHGNLLHNLEAISRGFHIDSSVVGVFWLPSYHDMGLIGGFLEPMYLGGSCIWMSPVSFLQRPVRWLEAITRYRGNTCGAPNFAYDLCVEKVTPGQKSRLDLSSWTLAFCGAEPIRPETLERFARTFEPCGFRKTSFYPCFGMAESTLIVSGGDGPAEPRTLTINRKSLENDKVEIVSPENEISVTMVNCGKSIIDQRIVIVNPNTMEECSSDEVGEIWVTGPSVAQGYWGLEEDTLEHFQAHVANTGEGPFLRTGDLGFLHEGELFITGRLKDLIIIHGSNHYPQDIELTVETSHTALQASGGAAFSVANDGQEKLVIVQEVTRKNRNPDIDEVTSAIRQAIAEKHELQVFAIVLVKPMSIPKTSSGKIKRRATKAAFLDGELKVVGEWKAKSSINQTAIKETGKSTSPTLETKQNRTASEIQSWLTTHLASILEMDTSSIDPRQPFTYYGLASVQAVSLTGDLEIFLDRKLTPTLAWDYPTVELLANHLANDVQDKQTKPSSKPAQPPPSFSKEPVAIIGLSCRFPLAPNPQAFWELLRNGVDAVTKVPSDRWDVDAFHSENPDPGKVTTRFGAFLDNVDLFDPAFFGISPREATRIDPQQRLLLEVSWEALENAFIPLQSLSGTRTGVFIGISSNDYSRLQFDDPERIDAYAGTGNAHSIAANRLSYVFDLRGPSMAVDTACSSSLVSTHLAVQSLRNGESDLALAGGVNLILTPELTITFSQARMLSPDGHCKTFDAGADGYVRGEGCGIVILKRLSDALRDGDHILALIRGSAVNQDGRSNGLTAPNGLAQQDVIRYALSDAGVVPHQISYVEAHGTGTPLGDPIEINSLRAVLDDESKGKVLIGSVKTNIGHLESAAGIAGLIKSVLALQNESIPPHLHLREVNPYLSLEDSRLEIGTYLRPWKRREGPRFAGISSFGFGGTNAHIIISDAPQVISESKSETERPRHLLTLSAKTESALQELAQLTNDYLSDTEYSLADFSYTANTTRSHFEHRLALHASTKEELKTKLSTFTENPASTPTNHTTPKVAFLFTGQGSQYPGMGKQLYETQPVFRTSLDECAQILDPILNHSLLEILFSGTNDIHQTTYTQPALFAFEYALAQTWRSWGIEPHAVLGHSVGEYVAACISGVFSLEDGLHLTAERARLMGALPQNGTMAVVFADATRLSPIIQPYLDKVSIAATNGPENTVISGEKSAVQNTVDELTKQGISSKPLTVSHAFHSSLMDLILDDFESAASRVTYHLPRFSLSSNLLGGILEPDFVPNASYWRDHIRAEVKFAEGMESISSLDIDAFIEIGPSPVLLGMGRQCLPTSKAAWLPSLRHNKDNWQIILDSLGKLYAQGADINWAGFDEGYTRHKASLPNYPFDRQRYWIETSSKKSQSTKSEKISPSVRSNGKSKIHVEKKVERRNQKKPKKQQASINGFDREKLLTVQPAERQKLLQDFIQKQTARILGMDTSRLNKDSPLDTLGLDSLMAMELKNSLESKLGVQLPVSSLLQGPSVSGLVTKILEHLDEPRKDLAIISSQNEEGFHPLTHNQQSMWLLDQLMPEGVSFNVSGAVRLFGDLDRGAWRRAFADLMARHAVLRTTFHVIDGEPMQRVHAQMSLPIKEIDASGWTEETLQLRLEEYAFRSFDLERQPAFRVVLFRLSVEETVALVAVHHTVTDFWSMTLLASEIMTFYAAEKRGETPNLPPLRTTYTDFAHWRNDALSSADGERHWEYWRDQLSGELPILNLPADHPRKPLQTYRGETQHLQISVELTQKLKDLSSANGATLYMTLLATFQTLLHRYSGQSDILVGSAMTGRTHPDLAGLMGYFVNPVGMRSDFSGDPGFSALLGQVRQSVLNALDHQDYPPALLAERLHILHRDASRPPLFETTFIYEKAHVENVRDLNSLALGIPGARIEFGDLIFESMSLLQQPSQFDLTLMMAETGDKLSSAFIYNPDLFDTTTIQRMLGQFRTLLKNIVADPHQPVSTYSLLSESERRQILIDWNDTQTDYPLEQCIHQQFEAQVEKSPEAIALSFNDEDLSYRELNRRANQLAHHLRDLGIGPDTIVGVFMERSLEMVIALYGILKAGGAYVPIDPDYPLDRIEFMLEDTQVPVVLTQEQFKGLLGEQHAKIICLDSEWSAIANENTENPPIMATADNLAYVIFTSGSTGKPKGAMNSHRGIANRLFWMQEAFQLTEADCVLQKTPFSFDVSVWEFFWPLLVGARLVIANPHGHKDSGYLIKLIAEQDITTIHFVPSMLQIFLEDPDVAKCETLNRVICSGEALPYDLQKRFFARMQAGLYNLYGPTEAAIDVTYWQCQPDYDLEIVPIGRPIANTQLYIMDENMQPVPVGVAGELYIGGVQVAKGYLNRPELTAERFVSDPFSRNPNARLYKSGDLTRFRPDGNIEYLGRLDFQVKIRGFRIELGEIESAISGNPAVHEAVVTMREDTPGDKRLIAYIVPEPKTQIDISELRSFLKERLPEYMIPASFVLLDALPLNSNGKVDRKALSGLSQESLSVRTEYVAPRNPDEQAIADICSEVLNLDRVGVHDNFFDIGGNSLIATRLIFQLQEHFQVRLPLVRLFEDPTIVGLAKAIDEVRALPAADDHLFGVMTLDELKREVMLDDAIGANGIHYDAVSEPKHILLTGATGFLGAYLLKGLTKETSATIYCLIRAGNSEDGLQRLKKNLEYYQLWDDTFIHRILIIPGDLERPHFGLPSARYESLAGEIDMIYHNGAMVNFVYPYRALKPVNVDGTHEVLRLASEKRIKPVHFVSSPSVFMKGDLRQKDLHYENANLEEIGVPFGGYGQSKWVAEGLMRSAAERGIPMTIFRPDNILGDRTNGILNTSDMTYSLVRAIFQMESVPDVEIMGGIVPVDFVSDAILHISSQPDSLGKTFHLSSLKQSNFVDIFGMITEMGIPIKQIPLAQWKMDYYNLVKRFPDEAFHAFLPIINQVGKQQMTLPRLDLTNTLVGLAGSSIICPSVDERLVETYVKYFIKSGLLLPADS